MVKTLLVSSFLGFDIVSQNLHSLTVDNNHQATFFTAANTSVKLNFLPFWNYVFDVSCYTLLEYGNSVFFISSCKSFTDFGENCFVKVHELFLSKLNFFKIELFNNSLAFWLWRACEFHNAIFILKFVANPVTNEDIITDVVYKYFLWYWGFSPFNFSDFFFLVWGLFSYSLSCKFFCSRCIRVNTLSFTFRTSLLFAHNISSRVFLRCSLWAWNSFFFGILFFPCLCSCPIVITLISSRH